jgi:crotonobetainyl-CoA:carnitine CoA-transferase CaiB-like acyl-CoA transferase
MSITGEPGGAPVKVGVPIADLTCALYATIGVFAALQARARDGKGQFIDVSLLESAVSLAVWEAGRYLHDRRGSGADRLRASGDRAVSSRALRRRLVHLRREHRSALARACDVLGPAASPPTNALRPTIAAARQPRRAAAEIEAVTTTRSTAHWIDAFTAAGIPCGPIWRFDRVFADPHLAERGFFPDVPHPVAGPVTQIGSPLRFSRTPGSHGRGRSVAGREQRGDPARSRSRTTPRSRSCWTPRIVVRT